MLQQIDANVHGGDQDTAALEEIISAEFSGFDEFLPVGLVGQCYLGPPYEVHTLNRTASAILQHYPFGEALPAGMERARKLALHPSYEMIEVYQDRLVAVLGSGDVVEMREDK